MFEAVTTENTPLEEKQVADIMKKGNENKDEVKDFVTELGNAENLQKIQAIAKNPLTLLAETLANSFDDVTKTSSITLGTEKYSFTPQECAEIFLAEGVICQDKPIAKNLDEYRQGKLLIDFDKGRYSFGKQVETLMAGLKAPKTVPSAPVPPTTSESTSSLSNVNVESLTPGQFNSVEIKNANGEKLTKIRIYIPEGFNATKGQLNMFFCGMGVTVDQMENDVFKKAKLKPFQAYCIVEGNYAAYNDKAGCQVRYNKVINNFDTFKVNVNALLGGTPEKVCLIGHSAGGGVVNTIMATQKSDSKFSAISVDGKYSYTQDSNIIPGGKVYYVPDGTTALYAKNGGIPIEGLTGDLWTKHFAIIPKALENAGILEA